MIFSRKKISKEQKSTQHLSDELSFVFIRSPKRQKSLSLRLNKHSQWEVRAPLHCDVKEALAFVHSKQSWMQKQIEKRELHDKQSEKDNIGWSDDQFQFLFGQRLKIQTNLNHECNNAIEIAEQNISFHNSLNREERVQYWNHWLKSQAMKQLPQRTIELAKIHNLNGLKQVKLRSMKSMWGNCRSNGIVTLNTRLIQLPADLADSVICHELCHLVHMNHSKKFYQLLSELNPNWKQQHQELKPWGARILRI